MVPQRYEKKLNHSTSVTTKIAKAPLLTIILPTAQWPLFVYPASATSQHSCLFRVFHLYKKFQKYKKTCLFNVF